MGRQNCTYCKGAALGGKSETSGLLALTTLILWTIFLLHATLTPHKTGDSLKQKTTELVGSIDRETAVKTCLRFKAEMEEVVAADSNSIE